MPNTLLTPDIIARAALANLYETMVMAPLVHRDYEDEFAARVGDTITIRKPAVFTAEEYVRANGITVQDATEGSVAVVLDHFADVSFAVTAEELTLELQNFNEQLLNPAMEAIAQKVDRDLLALRADITQEVGLDQVGSAITLANPSAAADDIIDTVAAHGLVVGDLVRFTALTGGAGLVAGKTYRVIAANLAATTFQVSATAGGAAVNFTTDITAGTAFKLNESWNSPLAMIAAATKLSQANVPLAERRVAVGPISAGEWLKDPLFHQAQQRGDTEGLREASIGRKFGFDSYMTQNIEIGAQTTGLSTTEEGIAFHRTAFALAFRPLALPQGAQRASIQNYKGFGLRVVIDYDMDKKQDVVSIDCLYGTKTLDPNRAVLIKGADVV